MLKKIYILALGVLLSIGGTFAQAVSTYGDLSVSGANLVDKNNNPVQLQGMSLFWSNWSEGHPYWNEAAIQKLRDDWCINVVRAAMGVEANGGYISDPTTNMTRVKAVIDAAIALDIYVIVDFHSHAANNYKSQAKAFFKEIAQTYGSKPNIIYEVFNEPLDVSWTGTIKPYCEEIIDEIRKYDTENVVICGTRTWSQRVDEVIGNKITNRGDIAYTCHFYAGSHFDTQRGYVQQAINNNICVFITEYGTVNANGNGSVNAGNTDAWFEFITDNNLSHCNWSVSNKNEGASILKSSVGNTTGGWSNSDYTTSGLKVKTFLNAHCPTYGSSAPTITKDVEDVIVYAGYDATFKVFASGGDLSYQWYSTSGKINGATSNSYTITAATTADEKEYWAEITNAKGDVTSSKGNLIINSSTPYLGSPFVVPTTKSKPINAADFDAGDNYLNNPTSASYFDDKVGNDVPSSEAHYLNYRPETDGDFGTTYDASYGGDVNMLSYLSTDEWFNYTIDVKKTSYYKLEIRCISGTAGGKVSVEVGGVDVTGSLSIPVDADYYPLQGLIVNNIELTAGVQILRLNIVATSEMSIANIYLTESPDVDCNGELNGNAFIDDCDVCVGGSTGLTENSLCEQDCYGTWGGDAYIDNCDECVGGATKKTSTCEKDCHGTFGGTATLDACDVCVGGETGVTSTCVIDCNGDENGTATLDECNVCVGGKTGVTSTCEKDCHGTFGGTATLDECDICVGGKTGKTACDPNTGTPVNDVLNMEVVISPNPFTDIFTIDYIGDLEWEVSNVLGQVILRGTTQTVDMSAYSTGSYIIKLSTGQMAHIVKR